MARKLRIQYAEAIYHVVNRGNYGRQARLASGVTAAATSKPISPSTMS